jgi:asparagine synthase (glutamine-hydrolysing)
MADVMRHRGPDDRGVWTDRSAGLALGFRRLAIVDLSPEGRQPMLSASARYVLAFNGEVYNFLDLRKQLEQEGCGAFRGHSDTEVMLACFERWGVEHSLERFSGMFAFALWDQSEKRLHLARDRMGEKPLYYGWMGRTFLFASELKSVRLHPEFRAAINRGALALYLRHGYIPAPHTIFEGIHKLPPASLATLGMDQVGADPEPIAYWSARRAAEAGTTNPFPGSPAEAVTQLEQRLRKVIQREMIADVPLGAFLSGGIDSSTVVALMQAESSRPVRTFTIGFSEGGYDEAVFAKAVARHLGTDHTELYVSADQTRAVIPRLPTLFDEPYADSSAIPTYLVSEMARREVTVSLSGDGGDELFGGYPWYQRTARVWRRLEVAPPTLRRAAASILSRRSSSGWDSLLGAIRPVLPASLRRHASAERAQKFVELMGEVESPEQLHKLFTSHWDAAEVIEGDVSEPSTAFIDNQSWAHVQETVDRLMYLDQMTYLPDDILTKVDRASMAVSLESRAPFLDHGVVEFAWSVPSSWKLREGRSKWLLRQLLYRHVPEELIERPKMGFSVPLDVWLRGPLLEWAEALLTEDRLRSEGFLNPAPIRRRWREHLEGRRDWSGPLWVVLMFQSWLDSRA